MERITYQRTLDVHKNGVQFTLQGVETGDNLSRVIEISLMASGDAIDFPLEKVLPVMYVRTPNSTEPSIIECTIKNNVVVYEVLPITEEGITEMQLKLIETSPDGATSVLVAPRFAIEVTKSSVDDGSAEQKSSFTALENAVAKAKEVYDERFLRMELDSECIFRAYYADGTTYETDVLQKLFRNGNVLLSESWAKGGTGVRVGEDTNNSMYYSNVSKSASLEAKDMVENGKEILDEVKLHGVYTAFSVDFETGEVEYVSPSFKFSVNMETGDLDAEGQSYSFDDEVGRVVADWLAMNGVVLSDLQNISILHAQEIDALKSITESHTEEINGVRPVERGGTGADNGADAIKNLGIDVYQKPWNVDENVGQINLTTKSLDVGVSTSDPYDNNGQHVLNTKFIEMPMINSGDVYLRFGGLDLDDIGELDNVTIYINDSVSKVYTNRSEVINSLNLLSVSKGDVVKISLSARCKGGTGSYSRTVTLDGIALYANIDTAYKYTTLIPGQSVWLEGSINEIKQLTDALLGV